MWYKKAYYQDQEGLEESFNMHDIFCKYYDKEKFERPEKAKGLAMFGSNPQYFHSSDSQHGLYFFFRYKCESISFPPNPLPTFMYGDSDFAEALSKNNEAI